MNIEIKISKKPVNYEKAIKYMEKRLNDILFKNAKDLIWILEHTDIYTAGTSFNEDDILDKSIKVKKTNRGGKITFHGPGQIMFYFVINLNKKKKDIRWFINVIEKTIIQTLSDFNITSKGDKKDIGIWVKSNNKERKIASIGIKIKKWVAYHGFALNYSVNIEKFKKIIPCGIKNKQIINIIDINKTNFNNLRNKLIKNFIYNLNN